jgi:predicted esterase
LGPFDCIFGFSQGAAIVGALCALESLRPKEDRRFKSAILASGYVSAAHLEIFDECKARGNIDIPSLHIYGDDAKDGQISNRKSEELMSKFRESVALRHDNGHLIPSSKEQVGRIAEFVVNSCSH